MKFIFFAFDPQRERFAYNFLFLILLCTYIPVIYIYRKAERLKFNKLFNYPVEFGRWLPVLAFVRYALIYPAWDSTNLDYKGGCIHCMSQLMTAAENKTEYSQNSVKSCQRQGPKGINLSNALYYSHLISLRTSLHMLSLIELR